jgi:hypothetical protein
MFNVTIAGGLTPAQARLLISLEEGPKVFNGRARRTIRALEGLGLVEAYYESVRQVRGHGRELAQRITAVPSWRKLDSEIAGLCEQIEAHGWSVEFPRWCEDRETPGILGQAGGVTVHNRAAIKVKTERASREQVLSVLRHEIEHMYGVRRATDHPELGLRCGGHTNVYGETPSPGLEL